jgi:ACS family tartrate transporter-like MFS transporter
MGLSIAAFGIWGTVGPFWALARACLGKDSAAGIAVINSVGALGGFVGPDLIGRIKALNVGGFNAALYLLAGTAVLTSLLAITSPREPKV